jgi:copper chaperone
MLDVIELRVEGMTCAHCVRAVTQAIQAIDATAAVSVDLAAGVVRATTVSARAEVAAAVAAEGYKVVG